MKEEIIIYGASMLGKIAYLTLKEDYNISFFCDGDVNKIGKIFDGVEIFGKEELLNKKQIIVVIASMYYKEIAQELYEIGIDKIKVFNIVKNIPNLNLKSEALTIGEYIIEDYDINDKEKQFENINWSQKDSIIEISDKLQNNKLTKIAFFSAPNGGDKFLEDIIEKIFIIDTYEVKKVIVKNYSQMDKAMEWADICWFEWCDGLIAYASNSEISKHKKIICRLHYYEVFTEIINNIKWNRIDNVIFVSDFVKNKFQEKLQIWDDKKNVVIPNGINLDKFKYLPKERGYNIAFLASIDLRKNPMLVIQYFYEIWKKDNRYHLYFGGDIIDELLEEYLIGILKTLKIEKNVHFDGRIEREQLNNWFKDKHFIISGSIGEGHPVGIMEAMSCGLKPLIHYFPGVYDFYPKDYVYSSFREFKDIIENEYESHQYRQYIYNNFSLEKQIESILRVLK
jgi:Glycosyltransferase